MIKVFFAKPLLQFFVSSLAIISLIGCEALEDLVQANQPPSIERLIAGRNQLVPHDTTVLKVVAHDPEGDMLSFQWRATGGTFSSTSGEQVIWTAPVSGGSYRIFVTVRDDKRGESEGSLTIAVIAVEKPVVKITQPVNGAFIPGLGVFIIEALASHPNGIQRAEFRVGNTLLGVDNSPPYQQPWRVEGLSGPASIIVLAFRAGTPGEPGIDSVRVSVEGATRL